MFLPPASGNASWVYDDPAGILDVPLRVESPQPHRGLETTAPGTGLASRRWVHALIGRVLSPASPKAV